MDDLSIQCKVTAVSGRVGLEEYPYKEGVQVTLEELRPETEEIDIKQLLQERMKSALSQVKDIDKDTMKIIGQNIQATSAALSAAVGENYLEEFLRKEMAKNNKPTISFTLNMTNRLYEKLGRPWIGDKFSIKLKRD